MMISEISIAELEEATKDNGGLNFQIALNYGSRDEIDAGSPQNLPTDCAEGKIKAGRDFMKQLFEAIWIHMGSRIRIF